MQTAGNLISAEAPRERRRFNRMLVIQPGHITFGDTKLRCIVLDLSTGGAKVQLLSAPDIFPENMALILPDGTSRHARMRWRKRELARFQFLD